MERKEVSQLIDICATDWWRGIAVVMVVASHYAEWWSWFTPTEGNAELFRVALTRLGVYGVDLFFLFSGYAMVKSLGAKRMTPAFVWKRLKNVYIPYFVVVGAIELLSGGFTSVQDFLLFASGYDYWYMFVLFIFYIGFMLLWALIGKREIRVILFAVFTWIFSFILYDKGMSDFWYVSNIAFLLGVVFGEYDQPVKKAAQKAAIPAAAVLAVLMVFVVRTGLGLNDALADKTPEQVIRLQIAATVVWTLLIFCLAVKCRIYGKIFGLIGKCSLYIYLTHTFLFMRCVNSLEDIDYSMRFFLSAVLTVAVSLFCQFLLTKGLNALSGKKKTEPSAA